MSTSGKPVWPDPSALSHALFGNQSPPPSPAPQTQPYLQPFAQGLAGGVDMVSKFWGQLPRGTGVPGFLLPTLDVEELDKRIADLKAAESWLDVNLNLLRATVQGLEVQRHTIAAIRALGAIAEPVVPRTAAAPTASTLPPGWPLPQTPAPEPVEAEAPAETSPASAEAASAASATATEPIPDPAASMSAAAINAGNWLNYMQDQFTKVAQAALVGTTPPAAGKPVAAPASGRPKRRSATSRRKPAAKAARKKAVRRKASPPEA